MDTNTPRFVRRKKTIFFMSPLFQSAGAILGFASLDGIAFRDSILINLSAIFDQFLSRLFIIEKSQFNFVGRILGPRGMTAKQLEQETGCKIMVRGKGSMRDKKKVCICISVQRVQPIERGKFCAAAKRILTPFDVDFCCCRRMPIVANPTGSIYPMNCTS